MSTLGGESMTCTDLHDDTSEPVCQCCQQNDRVSPVPLVRLDPDVEFWRCDRCGYVWETRDDDGALDLNGSSTTA
jgi:hypothetical protein